MALVTKRAGAPAGTIKISVGSSTYTIDDGVNTQIDVTNPSDYSAIVNHPYFQGVGGAAVFSPATTRPLGVLATGGEPAGSVPVLQLDGTYKLEPAGPRFLYFNGTTYGERPNSTVPHTFIGPSDVAPTDMQVGDFWWAEDPS